MVSHKENSLAKLREQIEKIERELCAAANSIHLVRQTMNKGPSIRALIGILDWGGAPENRPVNAPEDSEAGEGSEGSARDNGPIRSQSKAAKSEGLGDQEAETETATNMEVDKNEDGSGAGDAGPVSDGAVLETGVGSGVREKPLENGASEELDRELARRLMREENAAAREEQMRKRKRDVSREGGRKKGRRYGDEEERRAGVEFRVTVENTAEDGRVLTRAYVEDRRYDVEDWLTGEVMEGDEKREAFLKATEDFIQGARQTRSDKLAEIPAVEGELKYFHELMEELERKEKDDGKECLVCGAEDLAFVSMTPCGHWYCSPCLTSWLEGHKTCPTCRQGVGPDDVMHVNLELQGFDPGSGLVKRFGTKPAALCEFIKGVVEKEKGDNGDREPARFIVFSQWHSMLQLVARTLADNGIKNVSCAGDQRQRDGALTSFRSGAVRVLMLSMEYAASGTNLQCANHVILIEPAGRNPGHGMDTEAQAIGRAARLGQKRLVTVTRFLIEGTVEEDLHRRNDEVRARAQAVADGQKAGGEQRQEPNKHTAPPHKRSEPVGALSGQRSDEQPEPLVEGAKPACPSEDGGLPDVKSTEARAGPGVGIARGEGKTFCQLIAEGLRASVESAGVAMHAPPEAATGPIAEGTQGEPNRPVEGGIKRETESGVGGIAELEGGRNAAVIEAADADGKFVSVAAMVEAAKRAAQENGAVAAQCVHTDRQTGPGLGETGSASDEDLMATIAPAVPGEVPVNTDEVPGGLAVGNDCSYPSDGADASADRGSGPSQESVLSGQDAGQGGIVPEASDPPERIRTEPVGQGGSQTSSVVLQEGPVSQHANTLLVHSPLRGGTEARASIEEENGGRALDMGDASVENIGIQGAEAVAVPVLDGGTTVVQAEEADYCPLGCGLRFEPGTENTAINEHIDMCLNQETLTQMAAAGAY